MFIFNKLFLFPVLILTLMLLLPTLIHAQTTNPQCPSCVQIPPNEIELYKELFPLIIWTGDTVYDHKSIVTLNGFLRPANTFHPVTITVANPIGNLVAVEQITPEQNGDFSIQFNTSSELWKKDGSYIIKAQSGTANRMFKTNIQLVSADVGTKTQCLSNEIKSIGDNGGIYCIPFKVSGGFTTGIDSTLSTQTKTLTLNIRGTNIESITLDLPRYILDAKTTEGKDDFFVVLLKGSPTSYKELEPISSDHRKIQIVYSPDREGQIQIIGTSVVPEFGAFGLMILVLGIVTMIILSVRTNSIKNLTPNF